MVLRGICLLVLTVGSAFAQRPNTPAPGTLPAYIIKPEFTLCRNEPNPPSYSMAMVFNTAANTAQNCTVNWKRHSDSGPVEITYGECTPWKPMSEDGSFSFDQQSMAFVAPGPRLQGLCPDADDAFWTVHQKTGQPQFCIFALSAKYHYTCMAPKTIKETSD